MTQVDPWAKESPDQTPTADSPGPANPFGNKRQRDRFGRKLDLLYPAPQQAPPDAFSPLLRKIAVRLDRQS
jgi:hypothetical protein